MRCRRRLGGIVRVRANNQFLSDMGNERRSKIVQQMTGATGIDEAAIHRLVHAFYTKVRADTFIGPIFDRVMGNDWDRHLAKMCDFWSSVMLMSGRYKGQPMIAHMRLKMVRPEHFIRWLELFRETAAEVCAPPAAAAFIARAENIARSLQLGMFFKPAEQAARSGLGPAP